MNCIIHGCDRKIKVKHLSFCNRHYDRWRKHGDPLAGGTFTGEPLKWLYANLQHEGDDCLIWPFGRTSYGYGKLVFNGKDGYAHEAMLELTSGPRPHPKSHARHLCNRGQEGCVNPRHMVWGTPKENGQDRVAHGTSLRGEASGRSKLTRDQVREIREKLAAGMLQREIALEYDIHRVHVSQIKLGKAWKWLA